MKFVPTYEPWWVMMVVGCLILRFGACLLILICIIGAKALNHFMPLWVFQKAVNDELLEYVGSLISMLKMSD